MTELRVGVLTPHEAPGPEVELPALSHGRVTTVLVRAGSPTRLLGSTEPAALREAAVTFRSEQVDAVAHASTTTGYTIGPENEATLIAELTRLCGVPAVATCAAAVAAMHAQNVERLQLVHPPWFASTFDLLGVTYFRGHGFHTVATTARALSHDPALIEPQPVAEWVERHLEDHIDGIYLAGIGFRTAAVADELQRRTGKVVVSANQALLRSIVSSTH